MHILRLARLRNTNVIHSVALSALLVAAVANHMSAQTSILIDDFNDGNADGWTTIDSTIGQHYGPGTFDASSGAYHLESAGLVPVGVPGGGFLASTWDQSSDPMFSNGFVRARVRAEQEGVYVSLALRVSGSLQTGFNSYLFGGSTGPTPGFFFNTVAGGQSESLRLDPSLSFGVNEDWNIEAGAVGDQISMKVWQVGDPEPGTPQLMFTDRSFSTGTIGVEANVNTTPFPHPARVSATFDDISFTPAEPEDVVPLRDEYALWQSPMPIPQTAVPPAFPQNSPERNDLRGDVSTPDDWPELRISGKVTDLDGQPIPGLKLDFFHADDQGRFDNPDSSTLRGHQFTDSDGNYELWTITPGQAVILPVHRTRLLHFFVGGENLGFESPVYRTETFFPEPFDKDVNADGTLDGVFVDGVASDLVAIGIEDDFFVPSALSRAGTEFSDLASNILTLNNDPLVDGYFDTTLNIVMPDVFQAPAALRLPGDVDGDGSVAFADFLVLSANFGMDVDRYALGDLNGDGNVAFADFLILSTNFGKSGAAVAAVPEPNGALLLLVALVTVARRRSCQKLMGCETSSKGPSIWH